MTDRPIIFSAPMILALQAGRKTQTRRVEGSPLRHCHIGDRLWVREAFTLTQHDKPVYRADACDQTGVRWSSIVPGDPNGEVLWRPSIHMPRWASRLTLVVIDVRRQRLQDISEADAQAEGIEPGVDHHGRPGGWKSYETYPDGSPHPHAIAPNREAKTSFRELWETLHGHGSWAANPEVIAISFQVEKINIDQMQEAAE
jgi:hypothetical protein